MNRRSRRTSLRLSVSRGFGVRTSTGRDDLPETIYINQGNAMTELPAGRGVKGKAEVEEPERRSTRRRSCGQGRTLGSTSDLFDRGLPNHDRKPRSRAGHRAPDTAGG